MSARHRLHERRSTANVVAGSIVAAVGIGGVLSAALVELTTTQPPAHAAVSAPPAVTHAQSLTQHGTVVAVTADSLTARSADGFTQTYALTPDTTAITTSRTQNADPAQSFAVNDQVAIIGTVQAGTPTATAVADQGAVGLGGAPMDSVDRSPV